MASWKKCGNCRFNENCDEEDRHLCENTGRPFWREMPCPLCGGILSDVREHDGIRYRHCFACHFEFKEGEG